MVLRSPKTDASLSSLKTIYLSGKAPWGFRIIDLKTSMGSSNIVVSKTRNNSKADLAGLKLNDTILYINDVPTSNLSLEAAAELIDNSENLCLIVSSKSSPIAKDESPDHVSELIDEFRGEETAIVAPNNRRELSSSMTSSSSLSRRTSSSVTAPNILTNPAYSRFLLLTYSNNSSNSTANNALNNASDKSSNISVSALSNNTASTTNTNTTTSSSDPDHYHKQQHRHENQNQNQRRTIDKNYINLISSHRRNLRNNTYYSSANESNDESDYSMSCSQYNNNTTSNNPRYNRSYNYNNSRNSNGKANSSISNYNHNSGSSSSNSNRLQSINRTGGGESLKRNEDNSEERRVSYASITLRQPVKDVNYFSDTEALTGGGGRRTSAFRKPVSAVRFSSSSSNNNNKNNSNKHCYESSSNNLSESTTNPNTFYSTSINTNQRTILSNNHNSDHNYNSFKRREPFENHTITNNNNYNNYLDYFSNIFLLNNKNNKDQMNQSSSSSSFLANNNNNFNQAMPNMFNLSTATDFNRKPHGFSKLSAFGSQPSHHNADTTSQFSSGNTSNNPIPVPFSVQPRTQPNQYVASANLPSRDHSFMQQPDHYQQQFQQPQSNNYLWAPQSQQVKMPSAALDDDIDDPVVERYEREMGSELSKPSPNKRNYADSYFYDSPLFRYPTIDEQKKLAKSIADTLEGSNPATSKYHKKKQTIMKQMAAKEAAAAGSGYDSETPQSPSGRNYYRDSPNDFSQHSNLSMDPYKLAALDNDSTVPDIIKRSIAKANMTDPVRMVQAPDNFRQQHYTEHVTHTEMPPKAAMSLAAALESDLDGKGGRGAQIFQRRKAKSEKWVVDESNVKKTPGQAYNYAPPPPQPQPPQPQPVYVDPHINSYENDKNVNFGDYNAKPRGWSNSNMIAPPKPLRIEEPSPRDEPPPQEDYYYPHSSNSQQQKIASLSYNPNKIDLTNWTHPRNQLSDHKSPVSISKDGIEGLKARFYESARLHEDAPPQQPAVSKVKLNKLSSHQNYLFNNKNAQDALKNSTNQYYNQNYYDESNIATSDL